MSTDVVKLPARHVGHGRLTEQWLLYICSCFSAVSTSRHTNSLSAINSLSSPTSLHAALWQRWFRRRRNWCPNLQWAYRYSINMSADPSWSRLSRSAFFRLIPRGWSQVEGVWLWSPYKMACRSTRSELVQPCRRAVNSVNGDRFLAPTRPHFRFAANSRSSLGSQRR